MQNTHKLLFCCGCKGGGSPPALLPPGRGGRPGAGLDGIEGAGREGIVGLLAAAAGGAGEGRRPSAGDGPLLGGM